MLKKNPSGVAVADAKVWRLSAKKESKQILAQIVGASMQRPMPDFA